MMYGIIALVGFIFGFILACYLVVSKYYVGDMEVNLYDPMKDTYKMYVNDFDKINKSKYILFKVEHTQK